MKASALAALFVAAVTTACGSTPYTASAPSPLTAPDGRSLYTFDKDQPGHSQCEQACAAAWPPFAAAAGATAHGRFSLVTRADGSQQWAYDSRPLYFFAGDGKPGDTNGDGKGGVWHLAREGGAAPAAVKGGGYGSSSGGYM